MGKEYMLITNGKELFRYPREECPPEGFIWCEWADRDGKLDFQYWAIKRKINF